MPERHQYFSDPAVGRLMGAVLALTGELFVVKAELEVLKRALADKGVLTEDDLAAANTSEAVQSFLVAERDAFAEHVFEPVRSSDYALELHWGIFGPGQDPDVVNEPADSEDESALVRS